MEFWNRRGRCNRSAFLHTFGKNWYANYITGDVDYSSNDRNFVSISTIFYPE